MRQVLLIASPVSGGGRVPRLLPAVTGRLRDLGVDCRVVLTDDLEHARDLTREALGGEQIPVAFGGDGLAGAVAGAAYAVTPGAALIGVLPGGSGNDFCRHSGIGGDPVAACDLLALGQAAPIDLGEANTRIFLGIASLGFDSEANAAANRAPRFLGRGIYVYGALSALLGWHQAAFTIETSDGSEQFPGWSVICANTSVYGAGMFIAPEARTDDGLLDVVTIRDTGRLHFLRAFPKVFRGTHLRDPAVQLTRAAEVRVSSSREFVVYADGEEVARTPVTVRALPAAVKVLLPASA
ncbi:unannotated protein [freshwater metagenome]|uniref:Unannotated protein n=1 Tax=freshwater metagenome TaxID=449393 RepID=A0A6J7EFZ1_9ZZZZ